MKTDTLIVGGGISGLHTAYELQKLNKDFILVEARNRLGGRILSNNYQIEDSDKNIADADVYDLSKPAFDLGPSWFWPGQTRIQKLIIELNLEDSVFQQHASGQSIYEDQQGNIQQGFYGISMEGAFRLNGGIQQLIANLEGQIDPNKIIKSVAVDSIQYDEGHMLTSLKNASDAKVDNIEINSKKVVLALPPRLAMSSITFEPQLSNPRTDELNSYATWMAGHAKIIVSYAKPFWLEQGLSGDAVSHLGPMREIHDASSKTNSDEKGYALFGFVGIPSSYRKGNETEIRNAAVAQLVRLFGDKAANPNQVVLKDWSQEPFTATEIDQSMNGGHAASSIREYSEEDYANCLIWSGTETADHLGGYNGLIEGALEASERTISHL